MEALRFVEGTGLLLWRTALMWHSSFCRLINLHAVSFLPAPPRLYLELDSSLTHFSVRAVSLKINRRLSGTLKGYSRAKRKESRSTCLLFQLSKYHFMENSLHKQCYDYKLWELQGIQPPIQGCCESWCVPSMTMIKGCVFTTGM